MEKSRYAEIEAYFADRQSKTCLHPAQQNQGSRR